MGGKGRRRREKNYRAAHGGPTTLPPAPKPSEIDALPSKLRKLIAFTCNFHGSKDEKITMGKNGVTDTNTKPRPENVTKLEAIGIKDGADHDGLLMSHVDHGDEIVQDSKNEKRKKKRKRKELNDLRFDIPLENSNTRTKRKERKKKYLEAKKNKHKKAKTEENLNFPGHEKIKFGEVVEAPPKLVSVPKKFKSVASQERLRLQAVESYRNRKGWSSRPGLQLPSVGVSP